MKNITKENLNQTLKDATSTLLEMARKSCYNKISDNTTYIISEIKNDIRSRAERKKTNDKKHPKTLEQITTELQAIYENLYDINLYIYNAKKKITIIEIQYYPKSSLESSFYETVKYNDPMLHCKIRIPPYINDKSKKYDVNWELGGIKHKWNALLKKISILTNSH